MARTINQIQEEITTHLQERTGLVYSPSRVAEWRLWTYVVAAAIHAFELMLDLFRSEINTITDKITPGTLRWYAEMCYRFQYGHDLLFDESNAMLYYELNDPDAQIIKVVAIKENGYKLTIKAATQDDDSNIIPLSTEEIDNFLVYINTIKFVGVDIEVISSTQDRIWYDLEIYYDPSVPKSVVEANVLEELQNFKASLGFDSMIYTQRLVDVVMKAQGVVTCNLIALKRKGASDEDFTDVGVFSELESGYFEYESDSILTLISTKDIDV